MIYLFKCKAAGDLLMLESSGDQLLRILGKVPAAQGIIEPAAMPLAILAIEEAIAHDESLRAQAKKTVVHEDRDTSNSEGVTLRQRAWPLLEMLKSAHAARTEIVWGV